MFHNLYCENFILQLNFCLANLIRITIVFKFIEAKNSKHWWGLVTVICEKWPFWFYNKFYVTCVTLKVHFPNHKAPVLMMEWRTWTIKAKLLSPTDTWKIQATSAEFKPMTSAMLLPRKNYRSMKEMHIFEVWFKILNGVTHAPNKLTPAY